MSDRFYFYKYVNASDAFLILGNSTLKFSNPIKFNDPYDYNPQVSRDGYHKLAKRLKNKNPHKKNIVKTSYKSQNDTMRYFRSKEFRDEFLNDISICCFSKSPFILPMWAHYADNHRGFVIEFVFDTSDNELVNDIEKKLTNSEFLIPIDVTYSDIRPMSFNEEGLTNADNSGFAACLTKAKSWSYEEEVRVIKPKPDGVYKFPIKQVSKVFIGMKASFKDIEKLNNTLVEIKTNSMRSIKIRDISMKYDSYELTDINFQKR
ncbi:DUF2971 domain-containing protein [Pectobacterium brasiliense]|uniref:DUF2971 domain-containing protein n=1 Tax=Pectobacterium brasiliense TaxID=180957 RepID=UPI00069A41BD|nr:DUF2971 domain-containing protein [Pectobacterium brasiliense]MCG5047654.1 DUF2971 domain-containing protein [Pectobacterium brasiliense]